MAELKFTKTELRDQQVKLAQLQKYLPTLQLKKAMLQAEMVQVRHEIFELEKVFEAEKAFVLQFSCLLLEDFGMRAESLASVLELKKEYENIAGVEIPHFKGLTFNPVEYGLFEAPVWLDSAVLRLQKLVEEEIKVFIAYEKKAALEKELREVSIRVNLFEKVMIPKALGNIKMIKVFLGDQQLAAVARAKVAKSKIEAKKEA